MTTNDHWLDTLAVNLPRHSEVVAKLRRSVEESDRWRWLLVGCSLGRGGGDELSDIDAGIGCADSLALDKLERAGLEIVGGAGQLVDVLVHQLDGWKDGSRRFAAEYANGVQLDLVIYPATWRTGSIDSEEVPVVDKDGDLAGQWGPPPDLVATRLDRNAREWVMLGWWAVSDIAKYLRRDSLFEAAARIETVRENALRLFAAANRVPFPEYGLTSLLDYPPFELPDDLAATYCTPADRASVIRAARAAADLLASATAEAAEQLGLDLSTPWSVSARERLDAVSGTP